MKNRRRLSREIILQALYAFESTHGDEQSLNTNIIREIDPKESTPEDKRFTKKMMKLWEEHMDQVDDTIQASSKNWRLDRISRVDISILRLGTLELLFMKTPSPVVINEAVELAKLYGTEKSGGFVNGVLHNISKNNPSIE